MRKFLVPIAASVAALLTSNLGSALAPTKAQTTISAEKIVSPGEMVLERTATSNIQLAQHASHASHASHVSHASHASSG